jgi:DNA polymerase III epsilon subunit-like protein
VAHTVQQKETFVIVDIEASGPNPGGYAMLSIGASTLAQPRQTFYVELQPDKEAFTSEAMAVNGLSLERLAAEGLPPEEAMRAFAKWVAKVAPEDARPVFAAFNAPFDWMFINDYFHRYLGYNPFGHSALDIKAYYMGLEGVTWQETSHRYVTERCCGTRELTHHALDDAIVEAEILQAMFELQETRCEEGIG